MYCDLIDFLMYLLLKIDYVSHSCIARSPGIPNLHRFSTVYGSLYLSFSSSFPVYILLISLFYSLFAAQAGASRVIAVEASEKMAAVATQVIFSLINSEIPVGLF